MTKSFIGIGSNLGDKKKNIHESIKLLEEKCKILKVSSLYETRPVGYKNQDFFLNGVIKIETKLEPEELLSFLQSIEKKMKRVRRVRNGPRTIDLDILTYGNIVLNTEKLAIPHERLHERLFVLEPFNEIDPAFVHPVLEKNIDELMNSTKIGNK